MQLNYLEVNGNLEEITCHGSPAFPMEVYLDNLDLYPCLLYTSCSRLHFPMATDTAGELPTG